MEEDMIKINVLIETIKQHTTRRITNKVIETCEEYKDIVAIDEKKDDSWITGITYSDETGSKQIAIHQEKLTEMFSEILN